MRLISSRNKSAKSILQQVNWRSTNEISKSEQRSRETHTPVISVFRWWARRSHSVMGSILDATLKVKGNDIVVSDPFSGGGTVTVEAARRNQSVFSQDLYPWPAMGLSVVLQQISERAFEKASQYLLDQLAHFKQYYVDNHGTELSHILRVRVGKCPECHKPVFLFPSGRISSASRSKDEKKVFVGCRSCGKVRIEDSLSETSECPQCGFVDRPFSALSYTCPHCNYVSSRRSFLSEIDLWNPVLVQEIDTKSKKPRAHLRMVEDCDPVTFSMASDGLPEMQEEIPDGIETHHLRESGFQYWGDIYTSNQAQVMLTALEIIKRMDVSKEIQDRLAYAVIGLAEMPAFLSRWDRKYAKAYEGIANHRYANTTLAVETNFLGELGRGTLPHRLEKSLKALKWLNENIPFDISVQFNTVSLYGGNEPMGKQETNITVGSSIRQPIMDESVDLILTDPPYYGDVQYGELVRIFHFWLRKYTSLPQFDEQEEAVPNKLRHIEEDFYETVIGKCLEESKRTLKSDGRIILTFHNKKIKAWEALCAALINAQIFIRALAVVRAENDADHSKRNKRGLLYDLVLECTRDLSPESPTVVFCGKTKEEKTTLAMGLALSEVLNAQEPANLDNVFSIRLAEQSISDSCIK